MNINIVGKATTRLNLAIDKSLTLNYYLEYFETSPGKVSIEVAISTFVQLLSCVLYLFIFINYGTEYLAVKKQDKVK